MKVRTKKKLKRFGKRALIIGAGAVAIIIGVKSCDKDDDNVNYIDYGISNTTNNADNNISTITSLEDAINQGFLSNVSQDELKNTIRNNMNIDAKIQSKLLGYIDTLYMNFPSFNNAVLNKNLSLLQFKELSREEMVERRGNDYTDVVFNPIEHIIYYVSGTNLDNHLPHEITHMISEGVFTDGDTMINIQFSDNGYGQGLEEEICTVFSNAVFADSSSYDTSDLYLLNQVIGSDVIINSFLNGNIYDICESLEAINTGIDSDRLVYAIDKKIMSNNYSYSDTAYSLIGEYFVSKETKGLYSDYVNYLPTYVQNCSNFQASLSNLGVSDTVIYNFNEKRNDDLAEATRDCYATVSAKDTVILNSDPNGMNSILSNVDGSELAIYNYLEDQYGVSYINYITLNKDDPSDGLFDLLSGQMVYPYEIYSHADVDYYIENEGINQDRLRVVHK